MQDTESSDSRISWLEPVVRNLSPVNQRVVSGELKSCFKDLLIRQGGREFEFSFCSGTQGIPY